MRNNWTALDHAAKIFTSGISKTETQVFRFSCELFDAVVPDLLQKSADFTLDRFPSFQVVLRRGFFWYYLEQTDKTVTVQPETKKLCSDMQCVHSKKLLFEITYFQKRINIEVFHVLSDGVGAMDFFNTLIGKYLSLAKDLPEPAMSRDASFYQSTDDSYGRHYSGQRRKMQKVQPACNIQGLRYGGDFLRNITGRLPVNDVLALSGEHSTSMTVLLASCLIYAIGKNANAREKRKPIVLSVPVDLRNFFDSSSTRNFFSTIRLSYVWSHENNTLEDIISSIEPQLEALLTRNYLEKQLDEHSTIEHNIWAKMAPLFLKSFVLHGVYKNSMRGVTATISNMGRFELEPCFSQHVKAFDICASTNKFQASVCSFENTLSIGCTTPYKSSDIERTFFRIFSEKSIPVTVMSNAIEEPAYEAL